jgi:ABC-2 type transport system ATP-binding protein
MSPLGGERAPGEVVIEARGLTKRYGSVLAVDDLSFTIHPGLVTGLLGPNGAGKSTTMRLILGLDRPSRGQALVNGVPYVKLHTPLRQVGALLDVHGVHGGRSAGKHLLSLAQSNGLPRARVGQVLELTGLTEVATRRVREFSLGMSQRLGIAAAMLGDPGALMFDEPVSGLDPEGIVWIRTFMRDLAAQGRTVLVSSHLMSEMALTADHLIVIGRGRLLADTDTTSFIDEHSAGRVRIRVSDPDRLTAVLRARGVASERVDGYLQVSGLSTDEVGRIAREQELAVLELFEQKTSLEAAFIETTGTSVEYRAGPPRAADATAADEAGPDRGAEAAEQDGHGRGQGT